MTNNPYHEMASAMRARSAFDGNLLLFKKGFWTSGKDAIDMNDQQLVALVDDTMFGWTKWEDKRPVDYAIGRVADGFKPPKRAKLGDHDQSLWSFDKDPWQFGFYLPQADDAGQLFVYSTSSRGGKEAIANLLEAYGDFCEQEGKNKFPLVGLSSDHYGHPEFGRVEVPIFEILAWRDRPANVKQIKPPAASTPLLTIEHTAEPAAEKKKPNAFDDEIPF
jgi:hypothetical protein